LQITPWPFPLLNPRSFLTGTVAEGRKSGGAAYWRRERSGGGSGEVWGSLAITSRGGSPVVVTGVGLAACASGRARRRCVLRPAHGGIAQSKCTGSFTGSQWCPGCKELESGSPCSSVHARRRSDGFWGRHSGTSSKMVFDLRARKALRSSREARRGVGLDGGGPEWLVHGGRARAATGTLCAEGTPANSCSDRTGSERGSTVMASSGFIGVSVGAGSGIARAGARGRAPGHALACQNRSNTCAFSSSLVQTLGEQPNVQIFPKIMCKVSSPSLGLSSLCEFQVKIWSGVGDMVVPSQVCLDCSARDKTHVKPCQLVLVQIFPGRALGILSPFCQLDHVYLVSILSEHM
jgi:hypothetical protein